MEPTQAVGIAHFLSQTDGVGKAALVVLLLMSVATWYLIVTKSIQLADRAPAHRAFSRDLLERAVAAGGGARISRSIIPTSRSPTSPGTASSRRATTSATARTS